ncbi:SRPBCC family protein [Candidatus Chloroploca sp. Khr17]|uniref:SRPBCC family protein n=1 Tax=Candidatus Chloroploca sp. Khr17 TaxID=2496869 RepID=UPI00101B601E|nr:SRPBCC family protein [Candidatus Chloroploca sp. Khr17]
MAVSFNQHVDIDAPGPQVWELVCDPAKWPLWIEQMEEVDGIGSLAPGAAFAWRHGDERGSGAVIELDAGRFVLKLATRIGDDERTHTFDVDKSGGFLGIGGNDARVRYTYSFDPPGGMLGDFVVGGNPADSLRVKNTLHKLKQLAESLSRTH